MPKALKSCPKSNISPNLVTLITSFDNIISALTHKWFSRGPFSFRETEPRTALVLLCLVQAFRHYIRFCQQSEQTKFYFFLSRAVLLLTYSKLWSKKRGKFIISCNNWEREPVRFKTDYAIDLQCLRNSELVMLI